MLDLYDKRKFEDKLSKKNKMCLNYGSVIHLQKIYMDTIWEQGIKWVKRVAWDLHKFEKLDVRAVHEPYSKLSY